MNAAMHVRVVVPIEVSSRKTYWRQFIDWLMVIPPNPLVWYASGRCPAEDESPKTTVIRYLVLVPHDERVATERR